jgi:folate-binding Fe-S cluster repair protein YgfZ
MQFTRLTFSSNNNAFFIDRTFDEKLTAQQNCDAALSFISDQMKAGKVIPVMCIMAKDKFVPAMINLSIMASIIITDVSIYKAEQKTN